MHRLVLMLLVGATMACDGAVTACTQELGWKVTPSAATIAVGQTFTGTMQLSSCGGRTHPSDQFIWHSNTPAVASVDSVTGRVLGVAPGQATIRVDAVYFGVEGGIAVTVGAQ